MGFTSGNDINILQATDSGVVGAGLGDDIYVLSADQMADGQEINISDADGANALRLVGGLTITSSKVASDTIQLILSNGAIVNILGASSFTYEVGGTGLATSPVVQDFTTFVTNSMGLAAVPAAGEVVDGPADLGVNEDGTTTEGGGSTPATFTFAASADEINEGEANTFTVTASAPVEQDTEVTFQLALGTAQLDDFSAGSFNAIKVTIPAGETTATYAYTAIGDDGTELSETYSVSASVGGTVVGTAEVTILDGAAGAGQTFTLTAGIDTVVGTSGNDTIAGDVAFNSTTSAYDTPTLGAFDSIDGGAGTDTLNISQLKATTAYTLPAATLKNVENLVIKNDSGAVTADVQSAVGLQDVAITLGTADDVDVTTKSNVKSVTVTKGTTTPTITDNGSAATTADTLATVTLVTNGANAAISSDALTTLNLTNTANGATVTAAAGTRALTVNLNEVTGGTVTDATATTLNVNSTGKATTGVTLTAGAATSVAINADEKLTVTDVNLAAAKTITVAGDSAVTISATTGVGVLESVSSASSTGGLTITPALATSVAFTGGAGKDSVSLAASHAKAVAMGAGDDTVIMAGAVTTGGSVDAGEGTDTLSMTSAVAATVSAGTTFEAGISNFEKVKLTQTLASVTDTVNLANIDDINYLISAGTADTGTLAVTNMLSGGTLELTGAIDGTTSGGVSVAVKDAATGTSDVLNIKLNGTANLTNTANDLTVASVETINIEATDSSADTPTLTNPAAASVIGLDAADATKIVVTGNHGVDFTGSTLTKVVELDASGVVATGATTGATAAQIGTAGAVTFSSVVTDKAVTVKTGNGADVISVASINDATFLATNVTASTVTTGEGNDAITGSAGKDVVDAGAGNDTITGGAEADTLTGGAGNDKFVLAAAADSTLAKMDVITDFVANTYGQGTNGAATSAGANADPTKWTGDVIDLSFSALTTIDVLVVTNSADALTFLNNNSTSSTNIGVALDSSSGKLYIDINDDGTADSVIQLTGVTTIDEAAFII